MMLRGHYSLSGAQPSFLGYAATLPGSDLNVD
jgi:hypothetical protein